jgi:hypothetical protein
MKTFPRHSASRRGSLLIVAMLLSAVIGISLVSYLQLSRTAMNISNRALYNNAAMNLAEQGLEEAMYCVNQMVATPTFAWPGWTISGGNAYREWTGVAMSQNSTASYRVFATDYKGIAPTVLARARVTLGGSSGAPIDKWIEIKLRKTSKFSNGLVAKDSILFKGNNASVDSWNSHSDTATTADDVAYSNATKNANGSVGSISVSVNAINVNNANIYGYAATGGSIPQVGANGLIGDFSTASGITDLTRVSTDFSASFDPMAAPTTYKAPSGISYDITYTSYGGSGDIVNNETLPRATDPVSLDGNYYITASSINFNNKILTIADKVVIKLTNTITSIDIVGGSAQLNINPGASLIVYAPGDINIAGQGILNGGNTSATAQAPINCQIYGTKTSGVQNIDIRGNGVLSAVVYAPQGSVKINGNGDVLCSVVANDIIVVGDASFHYDESLANFGGGNPLRISKWKELTTAAERSASNATVINW